MRTPARSARSKRRHLFDKCCEDEYLDVMELIDQAYAQAHAFLKQTPPVCANFARHTAIELS